MTTIQITTILFSVSLFDVIVIWFLHKTSVYFRKMDKKVGNIERENNYFPLFQ